MILKQYGTINETGLHRVQKVHEIRRNVASALGFLQCSSSILVRLVVLEESKFVASRNDCDIINLLSCTVWHCSLYLTKLSGNPSFPLTILNIHVV